MLDIYLIILSMNKEEILFTECSNLDEKFTFFTVIVQYSTNNNSR